MGLCVPSLHRLLAPLISFITFSRYLLIECLVLCMLSSLATIFNATQHPLYGYYYLTGSIQQQNLLIVLSAQYCVCLVIVYSFASSSHRNWSSVCDISCNWLHIFFCSFLNEKNIFFVFIIFFIFALHLVSLLRRWRKRFFLLGCRMKMKITVSQGMYRQQSYRCCCCCL